MRLFFILWGWVGGTCLLDLIAVLSGLVQKLEYSVFRELKNY